MIDGQGKSDYYSNVAKFTKRSNIMRKMKKVMVLLAAMLVAAMLGGCGGSFDASQYVKALLDNSYKNDSEAFVKEKVGTKEEAEKLYTEGIDTEMASITTGMSVPEDLEAEFRTVLEDVYKNVKYTVGDANKKDSKTYEVEVKCEKMNIFGPTMESFYAAAEAYDGDTEDEAALNEAIVTMLADAFKETLPNVTYEDAETVTVRVELVNNVWTPNEDDIVKLQESLFDTDAASMTP